MIEALLLVMVALTGGIYLYQRFSGASDTIGSALRVGSSIVWIISGVFAILGGFTLIGFALILLFTFIGYGAGLELRQEMARKKIAGG